jgi:type IV pilus assembly protein PilM
MIKLPQLGKFKNKFARERISVGLDCGTAAVKLIKLKFTKEGNVELSGFNRAASQLDLEPVLKNLTQPHETGRVNVAVCAPAAIIRYVNFPKMEKNELQQALKFEAQKHIPFAISEVNLDSHILKSDLPDNKMLVLMAAVKSDFLNSRLKMVEAAGLRVNLVDIDSLALVNAFMFNYGQEETIKNKTVALLNIGASFSNLNILDAGIPRLSRDIPIAGNAFTHKIMEMLGVDFKAAEEAKLNPGGQAQQEVSGALEFVLSNLARELRVSFDYYESQSVASVGKIFLSGGSSYFTGLKDMLGSLLGIEVEYWDPLQRVLFSDALPIDKIKPFSNQLAVAVGLALRA